MTAPEQMEGWGTSSGLFTDYDGTVAEAWFGTDERSEQNPDKIYLFAKFINLTSHTDAPAPDEQTERWSIGGGWEVADGGKRIVPVDGSEKKLPNQNTDLGRIINRVLGDKDGEAFGEAFKDALPILAQRPGPRYAETWVGLRFHVDETALSFTNDDGEKVNYSRNFPTAYLGAGEAGNDTFAGEGVEAPESNGSGEVNVKVLRAKLTALARKHDDHGSFMDAALEIDGVADSELLDEVADDGAEGLYEQARA